MKPKAVALGKNSELAAFKRTSRCSFHHHHANKGTVQHLPCATSCGPDGILDNYLPGWPGLCGEPPEESNEASNMRFGNPRCNQQTATYYAPEC